MFEKFNSQIRLEIPKTKFTGYEKLIDEGQILALFDEEGQPVTELQGAGYLILDQTPLFAQGGGQDSDQGKLFFENNEIDLLAISKDTWPDYYLHMVDTHQNQIKINDRLKVSVDQNVRMMLSMHHSAIHLTWQTILNSVGHYVREIGSKETYQKYTMEFESNDEITPELVEKAIQETYQNVFSQNIESEIFNVSLEEAIEKEWLLNHTKLKPEEQVRMVKFADYALEPCSGTHVQNTREILPQYFLDFDKNPKRILINVTCNKEFAQTWFTEKNGAKYQEIIQTIEKLQQLNFDQDLSHYQNTAQQLVNTWSYLATKQLNNLLQEISKIANQFYAEKNQEIQEEYWNLELNPLLINNFLLYETKNENYNNKIMLKKASHLANQNLNQTLVFLNSTPLTTNAIIVHNKKINFNLRNWLNDWLKQTSFKGGGNDSMFQINSPKREDYQLLIDYLNQTK